MRSIYHLVPIVAVALVTATLRADAAPFGSLFIRGNNIDNEETTVPGILSKGTSLIQAERTSTVPLEITGTIFHSLAATGPSTSIDRHAFISIDGNPGLAGEWGKLTLTYNPAATGSGGVLLFDDITSEITGSETNSLAAFNVSNGEEDFPGIIVRSEVSGGSQTASSTISLASDWAGRFSSANAFHLLATRFSR